MKEQINQIKENALEEISKTEELKTLNDVKVKYLGKKGELTSILRGMGGLTPEERPIIGSLVNEVRDEIEKSIGEKEKELNFGKADNFKIHEAYLVYVDWILKLSNTAKSNYLSQTFKFSYHS